MGWNAETGDTIDNMQDVADREWHDSWMQMMDNLIYREEDYAAMEVSDEVRANEYYHELVSQGEDPIEAMWEAVEAFGLVKRFEPVDPMEPDYHALAREPERGDAWDAAEAPAVQ